MRRRIVTAVAASLFSLTCGSAECAWLLWVETPAGSDLWTNVRMVQPRFESAEECHRRAQELNDFEVAFARMQRAEAYDLFACLPDTVDPRPEGALPLDTADPRRLREK